MKNTQKHTASHWIIRDRADTQNEQSKHYTLFNCDVMPVAKSDYDYVGSICAIQSCDHIHGISYGEAQANARLIAAAPDLLAALKAMMVTESELRDVNCTVMQNAIAALAKAEGRPCEIKSMTDLYDLLDAENDATKAEGRA